MSQASPNIIWITSYPKSGNTWFRLFLSSVLNPERETIDINTINSTNLMVGDRSLIDRLAGTNMSDLTYDEIFLIRSEVYRMLSYENSGPIYAKVHDAWQQNIEGTELFPSEITKGVVLLVRNPFDISVSFSNHSGMSIKECISILNNKGYYFSCNQTKLSSQLSQYVSSWSEHFRSWVDYSGLKVLVIRYEDMMQTPMQTFSKALDYLEIKASKKLIETSIEKCSFRLLQNQEIKYGFQEKPTTSSLFFHTGKVNYWKRYLNNDEIKSLSDNHSEILGRLNYSLVE